MNVDHQTTSFSINALIKSLYIKNYALIDELEVSFGHGLNILTGQTGAGKSIIIGALNAVLGERADTETIRHGTEKAVVEVIIDLGEMPDPAICGLLKEQGHDAAGSEIILRREIRPRGSRAFVNDTPVSVSVLRAFGDRLVDLHGQHDHQLLLKEDYHREVVDAHPRVATAKTNYGAAYNQVRRLHKELSELRRMEQDIREKRELHLFQIKELESVNVTEEQYHAVIMEMKRLEHAEELDQKALLIGKLGSDGESNVMELIRRIEDTLADMTRIEPEFSGYLAELETAKISLQELLAHTERYRTHIEYNPGRLEELRRTQAEIRRMEKKYSRSLPELLDYRKQLEDLVQGAENFDLDVEKKTRQLDEAAEILKQTSLELHKNRIAAGKELSEQISEALIGLGIKDNCFETRVSWRQSDRGWFDVDGRPVACQSDGPDHVVFYLSTNRGELPRPLARIASGGEVSRVMLAMKSVIAREQYLPVMIFDEIDIGISGAIADKVGQTMHDLSRFCQIIAITHQVQIAGHADHHFRVEKEESAGRTTTRIRLLEDQAHVEAVASLMSGADVSQHALAGAQEMVQRARTGRLKK